MRISELRRHLDKLAAALESVRADVSAVPVRMVSDGLRPFGRRDVAELESLHVESAPGGTGPQVREFQVVLSAFDGFIAQTAKPSVRDAFNRLRIFVNDRQGMAIRSFIDALHHAFSPDRPRPGLGETIVDTYVAALQDSKHDDERFPRLFGALSDDERLNKDDVVEIASRFAFRMAKSTSKKTALERIWKMHSASETFAAKSRTMRGKSAA